MRKSILVLTLLSATALTGCLQTDAERAVAGGLIGAAVADATGGNVVTGAALGGLAGATCDDAGLCN